MSNASLGAPFSSPDQANDAIDKDH